MWDGAPEVTADVSNRENLFHMGTAGTGGTPRKHARHRPRPRPGGTATGANRSPLGGAPEDEANNSAAAAEPIAAAAAPVSLHLTADQLAALTPEERALIEKLSGNRPSSEASAATAPPKSAPATPPQLGANATAATSDASPPAPPPVPQPPTPLEGQAAAAPPVPVPVGAAADGSASSSCFFTIGADGPAPVLPPGRRRAAPSGISPAKSASPVTKGSPSVPSPPQPPTAGGGSPAEAAPVHVGVELPTYSPPEEAMPDAEVSPVFSIGAGDGPGGAGGSRSSRSVGRRHAGRASRRFAAPGDLEGSMRSINLGESDTSVPPREDSRSDSNSAREEATAQGAWQPPVPPAVAPAAWEPMAAGATAGAATGTGHVEGAVPLGDCTFSIGSDETTVPGAPRRPTRRKANTFGQSQTARPAAPTEPVASVDQPTAPTAVADAAGPRSAWASDTQARPATAPAQQGGAVAAPPLAPGLSRGASGAVESGEHPSWRLAEEQKERGNRRYAIKSWAEAHSCYRKALDELKKHPAHGTASAEGRALNSKAASYHANSAAALMQLGKLPDALAECDAALTADRKLGKALLRVAHVQLMLGDTEEARRYYVEVRATAHEPANRPNWRHPVLLPCIAFPCATRSIGQHA